MDLSHVSASNHFAAWMIGGTLVLGSAYFYQVHTDLRREHCQSEYNSAFAEQARIRSVLSAASDEAQTNLISGVGKLILAKPTTDPKVMEQRITAYRNLFVDFNRVTAQVEKDRAANPLPVTPDC